MKSHVSVLSPEELRRAFPISGKLEGWCFRSEEVSAGVFEVSGSDVFRRSVSRQGTDVDALLAACIEDARTISQQEPIRSPEMNFDSLVTHLELSLLPVVRKEEGQLRTSGKFSEVQVLSLRHADVMHAMGLACRPVWASDDTERLSLIAVVLGFEGLAGRINLQWGENFTPRTGSGYLKKEAGEFHSKLMSESEIARFEEEWRRMFDLFLRVAARGKPSLYLFRRLRGAPADMHGFKEEMDSGKK